VEKLESGKPLPMMKMTRKTAYEIKLTEAIGKPVGQAVVANANGAFEVQRFEIERTGFYRREGDGYVPTEAAIERANQLVGDDFRPDLIPECLKR
jgi:hypothetical protein